MGWLFWQDENHCKRLVVGPDGRTVTEPVPPSTASTAVLYVFAAIVAWGVLRSLVGVVRRRPFIPLLLIAPAIATVLRVAALLTFYRYHRLCRPWEPWPIVVVVVVVLLTLRR